MKWPDLRFSLFRAFGISSPEECSNNPPIIPDLKLATTDQLNSLLACGDLNAQFELSLRLMQSKAEESVVASGVELCLQTAEAGHTHAQAHLGWSFLIGSGVPKDDTKAYFWLRRAAEGGDAFSQSLVASRLILDGSDSNDLRMAAHWYR